MPGQTQINPLVAKYGKEMEALIDQHLGDDVEMAGFTRLPPFIENGVAQLVRVTVAQYKKGDSVGEYYVMFEAVAVEPFEHEWNDAPKGKPKVMKRARVKGLRLDNKIMPMCDNRKELANGKVIGKAAGDNLLAILNQFKLLLGEETYKAAPQMLRMGNWSNLAAMLSKPDVRSGKPEIYFGYRTFRGDPSPDFPNPKVIEQWGSVIPHYQRPTEPAAGDYGTRDSSAGAGAPAPNGHGRQASPGQPERSADDIDSFSDQSAAFGGQVSAADVPALIAVASDEGNRAAAEQAREQVKALCLAAGRTEEEFDNADWPTVLSWFGDDDYSPTDTTPSASGAAATPTAPSAPDEVPDPEPGWLVDLMVYDAKSKAKVRKVCEVATVDLGKRTMTVAVDGKAVTDPRSRKPVQFSFDDQLVPEE